MPRVIERKTVAGCVLGCWLILAGLAGAQQIDLAATRPPYYAGEPIQFQVVVRGLEEAPEPQCQLQGELPDGLHVDWTGLSPRVSESITRINGRVTRTRNVVFQFNYRILADRPGQYEVGPFVVTQGDQRLQSEVATLAFQAVEQDDDMQIELELPAGPVYVGQRVPVTIRWVYAGDVSAVRSLQIRAPLFDQFPFADPPVNRRDNLLPIQTPDGTVQLPAEVTQEVRAGKQFTVVVAKRLLVASRPGTFDLPPITASLRRQSRRVRSLFDDMFDDPFFGSRGSAGVPVRAVGTPQQLVIKPLPTEGRPDSFSGAVGVGFSLDVQANRTVVRVGDPISLNVSIRGQGNLENVGLPPLSADGGMSEEHFRLPQEELPGALEDGRKQFYVTVRVKDEAVSAIPSLAFSWFDTIQEKYVTTHSRPIDLQVMPAQVVSGSDVVSAVENGPAERGAHRESGTAAALDQTTSPWNREGADLAIETDPDRLLAGRGPDGVRRMLPAGMYLLGSVALVAAWLDQRRRQVDPEVVRRRRLCKQQRHLIASAAHVPADRGAEAVAAALRKLIPLADREQKREAEALVGHCEALIYAPEVKAVGPLDDKLLAHARHLAERISEESR